MKPKISSQDDPWPCQACIVFLLLEQSWGWKNLQRASSVYETWTKTSSRKENSVINKNVKQQKTHAENEVSKNVHSKTRDALYHLCTGGTHVQYIPPVHVSMYRRSVQEEGWRTRHHTLPPGLVTSSPRVGEGEGPSVGGWQCICYCILNKIFQIIFFQVFQVRPIEAGGIYLLLLSFLESPALLGSESTDDDFWKTFVLRLR